MIDGVYLAMVASMSRNTWKLRTQQVESTAKEHNQRDQQQVPWRRDCQEVGSSSVSRFQGNLVIICGFAWLAREHQERREKRCAVGGVGSKHMEIRTMARLLHVPSAEKEISCLWFEDE